MFGRIDHIGLAVADLESAIELHPQAYGMPLVHRETIAEQGVEAVLLDVGESHVELLKPLSDDTPVGRFLAARGPGLHHVAYQVRDVNAALGAAREAGLRLIDETPRTGIRGTQVAFLHPKTAGGVLTELVQVSGGTLSTNAVRRTALGFQGGQVLSLRLPDEVLNTLRDTLKEGRERWLEVEAADGAVLVDIGQVVYLRVESDEQRIGF